MISSLQKTLIFCFILYGTVTAPPPQTRKPLVQAACPGGQNELWYSRIEQMVTVQHVVVATDRDARDFLRNYSSTAPKRTHKQTLEFCKEHKSLEKFATIMDTKTSTIVELVIPGATASVYLEFVFTSPQRSSTKKTTRKGTSAKSSSAAPILKIYVASSTPTLPKYIEKFLTSLITPPEAKFFFTKYPEATVFGIVVCSMIGAKLYDNSDFANQRRYAYYTTHPKSEPCSTAFNFSGKTYYQTLGIEENAEQGDIRKAYMRLVKEWHPDKKPDNKVEAEAMFKKIGGAYEVLSKPEQRAQYDRALKAHRRS